MVAIATGKNKWDDIVLFIKQNVDAQGIIYSNDKDILIQDFVNILKER